MPGMWETPTRERGTPERGGDVLAGPPDGGRPANPWPRLLAFALVVAAGLLLAGVCVVTFARPPQRELRVELAALNPGTPRLLPVTPFGADRDGFTYGAWVTVLPDGRVAALLSRNPDSLCAVRWEPTAQEGGQTGVFVDRCGPARYAADGGVLAAAARDLDAFPAHLEGATVVVDLTQVQLGVCRAADAADADADADAMVCSRDGHPEVRSLPKGALPAEFGRR